MTEWNGNSTVFRGYAHGSGKKSIMKSGSKPLSWEAVSKDKSFGAFLQKDYVDISFDSNELSQKFWDMAEKNGWNCLILENPSNGHIHSYWKDTHHRMGRDGKDKKTAVGLIADVHSKGTYIPLRVDGVDRFPPSFDPDEIDEVPDELVPVNTKIDLLDLKEGDGRNEELFKYILILQSQLVLDRERIRGILGNINHFIFNDALSDSEMETITRDEAFDAPIFYIGKTFLHNVFGDYIKAQYHIKRINGQLHVYHEGIYTSGYRVIESKMVEVIPNLKAQQRNEVLKYLEVTTPNNETEADAKYIAFQNGVYDLETEDLLPFSPNLTVTCKIPWNYDPDAFDELTDKTLDKISCFDKEIRSLLEETIGYCFFRQNELSKAFILTGEGSNGKSTYLDMVKNVLGRSNFVSLDLDELSEKFSTTTMFGKLANIGDDISDDFLQGKSISTFKKVVSGNDIKAENKGQDVYFFKPFVKLLFSANEIPRMRNKGFLAIMRRLVIIPFNAKFTKDDPDFDSGITWKLKTRSSAEYLIQIGMKGLKRVLENRGFSDSQKVTKELKEFERDNNPLLLFLDEVEENEILNQSTKDVYARYDTFCYENGFQKVAIQTFSKDIIRLLKCRITDKKIKGRKYRVFEK